MKRLRQTLVYLFIAFAYVTGSVALLFLVVPGPRLERVWLV